MAQTNIYRDQLIANVGTHGVDISSQRLDQLDRQALKQVLSFGDHEVTCVELGCGSGWQGLRFALLGATVHLFDLLPEPALIHDLRSRTALALLYHSGDLRSLSTEDLPARVRIAFSQRFIHYLRYAQAQELVRKVAGRMTQGLFYLSASGLQSELGIGYAASGAALDDRFSLLSPQMQSKHGIREPVCLYTEQDMNALMTSCGFTARRIWTSPFGNIKAVFEMSAEDGDIR